MRAMVRRLMIVSCVVAWMGWAGDSVARAEHPAYFNLSEQQPPRAEDWLYLQLRRAARCSGGCVEPLAIPLEITYYDCPESCSPCEALHRSYRGCYGLRHPAPYYISVPTIVVDRPRRCPCGEARRVDPASASIETP
jgi:hypothetical protein